MEESLKQKTMQGSVYSGKNEVELPLMAQYAGQLESQLSQLAKTIDYLKDTFRRIDPVANNLNPDAYYKNIPSVEPTRNGESKAPALEQAIGGRMLNIYKSVAYLAELERKIIDFTNDEVLPTVTFFEKHI